MGLRLFVPLLGIFLFLFSCSDRVESFTLREGEKTETTGFVVRSGRPGPAVYVVAGVHGNEPAGMAAAEDLQLLKLKRGSLVVLPRANAPAAREEKRTLPSLGDLNRVFPGKPAGREIEELAWEISESIRAASPRLVLDLHESSDFRSRQTYALGNSLIFSHPGLADWGPAGADYLNGLSGNDGRYVYALESREGTINCWITDTWDIPALTFESDANRPLRDRIRDQRELILFFLRKLEMVDP